MKKTIDSVVVGGGFYGCCIAVELAQQGKSVILIEKENEVLQRASYNNQARVHGGYHYPRSFLTGVRSRENYARFLQEYGDAVVKNFTKLYAIAKSSKVTAHQFYEFCVRVGSPIKDVSKKYSSLFSPLTIETVFEVQEYAFDSTMLAKMVRSKMRDLGVVILLNTSVSELHRAEFERVDVKYSSGGVDSEVSAKEIFVATYSRLNEILHKSSLPIIPLRHELTEMALVNPPAELKDISVTVMDGPFWSMMPFPSRGLMTLSHVRYTPHYQWSEEDSFSEVHDLKLKKESNFSLMVRDAARFVPSMSKVSYVDSLWETKTIMPVSDNNDSRPILFKRNYGMTGLNLVLGGKIDNIFDIISMINQKDIK